MAEPGLRERKKARTRQVIAESAARLFAERGYDNVTVRDVAAEAEVAEQTVYNYFRTKEQLVTDRDQQVQDLMVGRIRTRPDGVSPAAAVRDVVLRSVAGIRTSPEATWRGELGYLAAVSPTVHRLALELVERQAAALAEAIHDTSPVPAEVARLQGLTLASVWQVIITEAGQRTRAGQSRQRIAQDLTPMMTRMLDELDRWFGSSAAAATPPARGVGRSGTGSGQDPRRRRGQHEDGFGLSGEDSAASGIRTT